jgi:hypothetical protein
MVWSKINTEREYFRDFIVDIRVITKQCTSNRGRGSGRGRVIECEGTRQNGRPWCRWEDNIYIDVKQWGVMLWNMRISVCACQFVCMSVHACMCSVHVDQYLSTRMSVPLHGFVCVCVCVCVCVSVCLEELFHSHWARWALPRPATDSYLFRMGDLRTREHQ